MATLDKISVETLQMLQAKLSASCVSSSLTKHGTIYRMKDCAISVSKYGTSTVFFKKLVNGKIVATWLAEIVQTTDSTADATITPQNIYD